MTIQDKNIAWFLPRPKPDHYKGGMPLYAEKWLFELAEQILIKNSAAKLNLFCGKNKRGWLVDINPEVKPDLLCDVHELTKYIHRNIKGDLPQFDIILADPPYSDKESKELYGTPKLNYKKWTSEAEKVLRPGGLLIVYHKYIVPNPNPEIFKVVKRVFIGSRTYHVPRVAIYFQKN